MAKVTRGAEDDAVRALTSALEQYESASPGAEASLYRQNSGAIRLRVIDRKFAGMKRSRRHDLVWEFLAQRVNEDILQEVAVLILLAPEELASSLINLEFEDPIPSTL